MISLPMPLGPPSDSWVPTSNTRTRVLISDKLEFPGLDLLRQAGIEIDERPGLTGTALQEAIRAADQEADFILFTHYHTIRESADSPKTMAPQKVMDWTMANSDLPGVSFWGFYVEDGGMMAVALSPYEQGEVVARMAVDIIENGTRPKDIPVETSRLFVMYMRESEIKKKMGALDLPLVYEAFAKATNNYYE